MVAVGGGEGRSRLQQGLSKSLALAGAFFPESEFSREPFPAPGDLLAATSNFANVVCDPSTLWSNEDVQACCAGASLTAATDGAVTQKDEEKFPGREVGVGGAGYVIADRGGSCVEEWAGPAGRKRTSYGAERVALTQASSRLTNLISEGPARGEDGVLPRVVILTEQQERWRWVVAKEEVVYGEDFILKLIPHSRVYVVI